MHERSIVKLIIDQVQEEITSRSLGRLVEIVLDIGEFSGVESALVESAFAEMASEFWKDNVQLTVRVTPLIAVCQICDCEFRVENFHFECRKCGAKNIRVVSGEEIRIVELRTERRPEVKVSNDDN